MPLFSRKPKPQIDPRLEEVRRLQASAANPTASAWVRANAGTGKTHVLTLRVLRLLLAGTQPERILALTYTKAAAAEMSRRVYDRLAEWVVDSDADLEAKLAELVDRTPTREEMTLARRLFAIAIETPGGLKVQTIHAFCERLLQRFALEADVSPGFSILDDQERAHLLSESVNAMLREATSGGEGSALARSLRLAASFAAEERLDALLREALGQRAWLEQVGEAGLAQVEGAYRQELGVPRGLTYDDVNAQIEAAITGPELSRARDILREGSASEKKTADGMSKVLAARGPIARVAGLLGVFLTKDLKPRANMMTKGLAAQYPDLLRRLETARDAIHGLVELRARLHVLEASLSLLRLSQRVLAHYNEAKAQRAALDFEDLVARAADLLGRSGAAEWVLFKLDGGLDHILVDEAQDTAPVQWQVVRALAEEFFSGAGARDGARTLFAVGDEKQSIYGFQGAAPEMFNRTGLEFSVRADAVEHKWQHISLALSFRSVEPLLTIVDRVFVDAGRTPGVGQSAAVRHIAHRTGHAGLVELWPIELPTSADAGDPWLPLDTDMTARPSARLAAKIADTIAGWLRNAEKLESEGRPIRAGDIIILVRKRAPFAAVMVSALKARGIAVAGTDRLQLTEQIAVMDLTALGQVMVLPEDDLALASVLKSPLLGLDDDDLLALAPQRKGSLWQELQAQARSNKRFEATVETLQRWRGMAAQMAPYEFYASLLDSEGQRARMLARLGPDAADPIDEFLRLALAFGEHAPPTLQGFLTALGESEHEIKRDMEQGRDEVRVMTVHGAKGLEAPIVFLPDTCHVNAGRTANLLKLQAGADNSRPFIWPVKGTARVPTVSAARNAAGEEERQERNRLLYVALTRARDRLYVAGFQNGEKERAKDCWYNLVEEALTGVAEKIQLADGRTLQRLKSAQVETPATPKEKHDSLPPHAPLPDWVRRAAPAEPQLAVPLAPSRLAPLEMEAGEATKPEKPTGRRKAPREPAILPPAILSDEARFLRGTLTHALLEHLPSLPLEHRERAAHAFLEGQASKLSRPARDSIVAETLAILRDPAFAPLFGPDSRAEVAIAAEIARPDRKAGPALRLAGKIDRLVQEGRSVLIVDYKTNRPPPNDPSRVADAYLLQLAAYRMAVQQIFPGHTIRSAILWTDGPRIMEIAAAVLDDYQQRLWQLDPANLDG